MFAVFSLLTLVGVVVMYWYPEGGIYTMAFGMTASVFTCVVKAVDLVFE